MGEAESGSPGALRAAKDPAILAAFVRMRRRQWAAQLPALALVAWIIWQDYRSLEIVPQKAVLLLLRGWAAGTFVLSFFNWRCPACAARLPWSRGDLHVCPNCWALLREQRADGSGGR